MCISPSVRRSRRETKQIYALKVHTKQITDKLVAISPRRYLRPPASEVDKSMWGSVCVRFFFIERVILDSSLWTPRSNTSLLSVACVNFEKVIPTRQIESEAKRTAVINFSRYRIVKMHVSSQAIIALERYMFVTHWVKIVVSTIRKISRKISRPIDVP